MFLFFQQKISRKKNKFAIVVQSLISLILPQLDVWPEEPLGHGTFIEFMPLKGLMCSMSHLEYLLCNIVLSFMNMYYLFPLYLRLYLRAAS